MMPLIGLSREEKEELVRDLYFNQGKRYHQIAKQARVSLRDIKGILNGGTQKERAESKAAQAYVSSQRVNTQWKLLSPSTSENQ